MKILLSFILFLGLLSPVHAQQKNDFFMLGGELSNSATTSVADIDKVMPIANSSTLTPHSFAAVKWPNSWIAISMPNMIIAIIIYIRKNAP